MLKTNVVLVFLCLGCLWSCALASKVFNYQATEIAQNISNPIPLYIENKLNGNVNVIRKSFVDPNYTLADFEVNVTGDESMVVIVFEATNTSVSLKVMKAAVPSNLGSTASVTNLPSLIIALLCSFIGLQQLLSPSTPKSSTQTHIIILIISIIIISVVVNSQNSNNDNINVDITVRLPFAPFLKPVTIVLAKGVSTCTAGMNCTTTVTGPLPTTIDRNLLGYYIISQIISNNTVIKNYSSGEQCQLRLGGSPGPSIVHRIAFWSDGSLEYNRVGATGDDSSNSGSYVANSSSGLVIYTKEISWSCAYSKIIANYSDYYLNPPAIQYFSYKFDSSNNLYISSTTDPTSSNIDFWNSMPTSSQLSNVTYWAVFAPISQQDYISKYQQDLAQYCINVGNEINCRNPTNSTCLCKSWEGCKNTQFNCNPPLY